MYSPRCAERTVGIGTVLLWVFVIPCWTAVKTHNAVLQMGESQESSNQVNTGLQDPLTLPAHVGAGKVKFIDLTWYLTFTVTVTVQWSPSTLNVEANRGVQWAEYRYKSSQWHCVSHKSVIHLSIVCDFCSLKQFALPIVFHFTKTSDLRHCWKMGGMSVFNIQPMLCLTFYRNNLTFCKMCVFAFTWIRGLMSRPVSLA